MSVTPYRRAAEDQLTALANSANLLFADLDERQQTMGSDVQALLSQISDFPVLGPEMQAAQVASQALQEVQTAQQTLQKIQLEKTKAVQQQREVLGHAAAKLREIEEISRNMPHKGDKYAKQVEQFGAMVVAQMSSQ